MGNDNEKNNDTRKTRKNHGEITCIVKNLQIVPEYETIGQINFK